MERISGLIAILLTDLLNPVGRFIKAVRFFER